MEEYLGTKSAMMMHGGRWRRGLKVLHEVIDAVKKSRKSAYTAGYGAETIDAALQGLAAVQEDC